MMYFANHERIEAAECDGTAQRLISRGFVQITPDQYREVWRLNDRIACLRILAEIIPLPEASRQLVTKEIKISHFSLWSSDRGEWPH